MRSKLSDWASIAEIVASVGVILSLIFVALALRESNLETRATNTQLALQSEMAVAMAALDHAEVWDKVLTGVPLAAGEETRRGLFS